MSLLDQLTIIIPTYNRQPYAIRSMRYWTGRDVTLHILDGSPEKIDDNVIKSFEPNVNYHHLPISLVERLKIGATLPITEYTVLLGDDEFFLSSCLEKCISEIEANNELVACMGRCLAFLPGQNEVNGWPASEEMKDYSVLQDDPVKRMIFHMNPYTCSTIYSIVKTSVWKLAMTAATKVDFKVHAIQELQFELGVCYLGKSKVIEELVWLRSHENTPRRKSEPPLISFFDWWEEKSRQDERSLFLRTMSDTLADGAINKTEQIYDGVRRALDAYSVQYRKDPSMIAFIDKLKEGLRSLVLRLMPRKIKDFLKGLVNKVRPEQPSEYEALIAAAEKLEISGVKVNYDELKKAIDLIIDFHSKEDPYGI